MNEHGFIRSVNAKVPKEIYRWKIADRYSSGVADSWYSGNAGDLWVEYKYLPRSPVNSYTVPLSALQRAWLKGRYEEGRNVAVIVGCPAGVMILTELAWVGKVEADWINKKEASAWIIQQTMSLEP